MTNESNEPPTRNSDQSDKGVFRHRQRTLADSGVITRACFLFYCLSIVVLLASFRFPESTGLSTTTGSIENGESTSNGIVFIERKNEGSKIATSGDNSTGIRLTRRTQADEGTAGSSLSSAAIANRGVHERVIANELECATPTIRRFVELMSSNSRVKITNINKSYGSMKDLGHAACAAIDISKVELPDREAAKNEFEKHDIACESHYNSSSKIAPIDSDYSHFHCIDTNWIAERKGKNLGSWLVTRYYSVQEGQKSYYHGSYQKDYNINCSGDCTITADGTDLTQIKPFNAVACPYPYQFGDRFWITGVGEVVCHDRGGSIKGKHLDLWAGIGDEGLDNIRNIPNGGTRKVYLMD